VKAGKWGATTRALAYGDLFILRSQVCVYVFEFFDQNKDFDCTYYLNLDVLVFLRIPVDYVSLHACHHWRYIVMQLCMHVRYMYIHTHRQNGSMYVSVYVHACMHQCTTVIVWHDLPSFSES